MAVISVPRELRETLGDAATDGLVDLLHRFGDEQREDLIASWSRSASHAGFAEVQKQFLDHQQQIGNLGKEIAGVRADLTKEIGEVHKAIAVQTRWLLTVLIAATVLIPVMQRVLAAVFP